MDAAIQTHGGNGMATEYGLADAAGASRGCCRIAPVSREMILNYVAQHALGLPAFVLSRPQGWTDLAGGDAVDLARNLIQRINVGQLADPVRGRPSGSAGGGGRAAAVVGSAEFNVWVNQIAHGLAERGYGRGDALGLASANSAEFLAVYYACAKLGLVCVPINLGWRPGRGGLRAGITPGPAAWWPRGQLVAHVRDAVAKVAAIADPAHQVQHRARLVVGARGAAPPNGCWPTTAPVGLSLM